ncbi:MAG: protein tyrosine phosphatase [Actinophytocola sp.]|nr:protein tyrosine phosphatase [Actinophytocola sp.]
MHVSFICTGNICRSPIAAAVFRSYGEDAGIADKVKVTSAGTGSWHIGEPCDPRAAEVLRTNDYDVEHVANRINDEHLNADLLLAADAGHLDVLIGLGVPPERARLLRSFDPDAPLDAEVPDPYYGADGGFNEVLAMIEAATPRLVDWVRERL